MGHCPQQPNQSVSHNKRELHNGIVSNTTTQKKGKKKAQTSVIEITESDNNSNIVEESIIPENNVINKKESRPSKKKRDRLKTTTNNAGNTVASNKQEAKEIIECNSNDATENRQEKNLEKKSVTTRYWAYRDCLTVAELFLYNFWYLLKLRNNLGFVDIS
eukprot:Seg449.4 transcript_id=Seg449.4/GoldUCD/mRNA.D3Y31 product="hypothetical protein" protein_id=Seg449.4/GoldUCD/D3Y31